MKSKFLDIKKEKREKIISEVAEIFKDNGIAILPTDTVYGIMTGAFNQQGQKQIYKLKSRSGRKPLILLSDSIKDLAKFVVFPDKTAKIVKDFWPGPLTLILPTTQLGKLLTAGRDDLGVRIPNCSLLLDIISRYGMPLMSTSANISGKKSASDAGTAKKNFSSKVDVIVDNGRCEFSFESTVIDMVQFPYVVIRKGSLDCKKLLDYV